LQANESNHRSYSGLGFIAYQTHSHDEAITFFKRALANAQDDAPALMGIGLIHRRLGMPDEALHWLEHAVQADGANKKAMSALLQTCTECLRVERAIATVERLVELRGEESPLLMTLGQLHLRAGNSQLADELMKKANSLRAAG